MTSYDFSQPEINRNELKINADGFCFVVAISFARRKKLGKKQYG